MDVGPYTVKLFAFYILTYSLYLQKLELIYSTAFGGFITHMTD